MHSLEYLLLVLSLRIRRETGSDDLADAAMRLASASHEYEPSGGESGALADMYDDWHRRFDGQLRR
jgi:hypothetical protein